MVKIADLLAVGRTFSFEFFPPKTDEARRQLEKAVHELGYACVPLTQMLHECADWYRRHGYFGAPDRIEVSPAKDERATWIPEH